MIRKVNGEAPFQVLASNFSIGPSNEGYTLQISADGNNYSDLFTVGPDTTRMVTGVANGSFYRLSGNESEVSVNWQTQCSDGQGGGGTGPQGPQGPQGPAGGGGDSGQVQTQIDEAIDAFSEGLEGGDPVVGLAKQLYSPDGVTSDGFFAYRTTAGDADVNTGNAELKKIGGNSIYPVASYNDSASLERGGEAVADFSYDIEWGELGEWTAYISTAQTSELRPQMLRFKHPSVTTNVYVNLYNESNESFSVGWSWNNSTNKWSIYSSSHITATTENNWAWENNGAIGTAVWDGEWMTITKTDGNNTQWLRSVSDGGDVEISTLIEVPNDIEYGEHEYVYTTAWTPSLPQALRNMAIGADAYVPQDGDVITTVRSVTKNGSASYPSPSEFIALGLNSFDYTCEGILSSVVAEGKKYRYYSGDPDDNYAIDTDTAYTTYAVYAVTGLENGYVIHSEAGDFGTPANAGVATSNDMMDLDADFYSTEVIDGNLIVYPTTAMPYIIFSVPTEDADKVCVHPRWSGYRDNDFEEYSESVIDLSAVVAECPLYSVGEVRNIIDLENGKAIHNISVEAYSAEAVAALVDGGKVIGEDFDFDSNYIYIVDLENSVVDITISDRYQDNDFSVEYFTDANGIVNPKVYAETYYMNNLVDKLRRLKSDFIHLDNLDSNGETGITYEYEGRLMQWVEGSGYTAEWLKQIDIISDGEGTGLIYTNIPDGQVLFEFHRSTDNWRKVVYSGNTLYLMETAGTVVCAVTVGNTFQFNTAYGISYYLKGVFKKGYIGFNRASYTMGFQNVWNGKVNGGHYELIDKYNYPYTLADSGIPEWNDKGQVVKKTTGISTKNLYINTTGTSSSNRTTVITNGINNGPDRFFAPTAGGTQGQILVSDGSNAAPVWSDWIKAVKITSDAYDALTTKDPNTLYLIVDE